MASRGHLVGRRRVLEHAGPVERQRDDEAEGEAEHHDVGEPHEQGEDEKVAKLGACMEGRDACVREKKGESRGGRRPPIS